MSTDKALIKRLQSKDEAALSKLYDKYSAALYGNIVRMCRDEQQAQNLLQDTFMTIWEKAETYNFEKGRFYTWAYRIAKNKTLNYLRKPNKLIQIDDFSVYDNTDPGEDNPIDTKALTGTIDKLEPHHKKAIELVYYKGLTHREAHVVMDIPLGTFKSYVRQAIKQLQKSYKNVTLLIVLLTKALQ